MEGSLSQVNLTSLGIGLPSPSGGLNGSVGQQQANSSSTTTMELGTPAPLQMGMPSSEFGNSAHSRSGMTGGVMSVRSGESIGNISRFSYASSPGYRPRMHASGGGGGGGAVPHRSRCAIGVVIPGSLYFGGYRDVAHLPHVQALRLTAFLCVAEEVSLPPYVSDEDMASGAARCAQLPLKDNADTNIRAHLQTAFDFIDAARKDGHRCVVYCQKGQSRSASIVAAYLMKELSISFTEALERLRSGRRADPNLAFCQQLETFAADGYALSVSGTIPSLPELVKPPAAGRVVAQQHPRQALSRESSPERAPSRSTVGLPSYLLSMSSVSSPPRGDLVGPLSPLTSETHLDLNTVGHPTPPLRGDSVSHLPAAYAGTPQPPKAMRRLLGANTSIADDSLSSTVAGLAMGGLDGANMSCSASTTTGPPGSSPSRSLHSNTAHPRTTGSSASDGPTSPPPPVRLPRISSGSSFSAGAGMNAARASSPGETRQLVATARGGVVGSARGPVHDMPEFASDEEGDGGPGESVCAHPNAAASVGGGGGGGGRLDETAIQRILSDSGLVDKSGQLQLGSLDS